jgi:CheY-like chemotaxis protein
MSGKIDSFTALILDDDEEIIVEISEAIEMLGGKVDAFSNPLKCLESLRNHRSPYDLVIVDLAMPVVNGLTFLKMASPFFCKLT